MRVLIDNVNIILRHEIIFGWIIIDQGIIESIGCNSAPNSTEFERYIDGKKMFLSPGFIELHSHGAGGHDYMDGSPEDFIIAAKTSLQYGTTSILPTTVSASQDDTIRCIDSFLEADKYMTGGPHMLGLHMEGPYLNPIYKGAMSREFLRLPDPHEYMFLSERAEGKIARWTVAPELEGACEMADRLSSSDVLFSIGHSDAKYDDLRRGFQHGYRHITHLFSAMSTITRKDGYRYSGVLESSFVMDGLTVEVIADGHHLPKELLELTYKVKGPTTVCLVTDSMRAAGTTQTSSLLGPKHNDFQVLIENNVAKLPDRSGFAGSIATSDWLLRVMHQQVGINLPSCIQMMSLTPATVLGIERSKGSIEVGKDADLVLFDEELMVQLVIVGGDVVHTNETFRLT